jgi:hypothetical protein
VANLLVIFVLQVIEFAIITIHFRNMEHLVANAIICSVYYKVVPIYMCIFMLVRSFRGVGGVSLLNTGIC